MNSNKILIAVVAIGVPLFSLVPLILLYIKNKHRDEYLVKFYDSCNRLRDYIHSCNSRAEVAELMDDIAYARETYTNLIPHAVLDKEIQLLNVLLNKKAKKIM
jgi:hypothetical protein